MILTKSSKNLEQGHASVTKDVCSKKEVVKILSSILR